MEVSEEQYQKAPAPMDLTELGILIEVKEHQAKASSPIDVTEFGMLIKVRE